jgi:hypothetical protein
MRFGHKGYEHDPGLSMERTQMIASTTPQAAVWPLTNLVFWILICAGYAVVAGGLLYAVLEHSQ